MVALSRIAKTCDGFAWRMDKPPGLAYAGHAVHMRIMIHEFKKNFGSFEELSIYNKTDVLRPPAARDAILEGDRAGGVWVSILSESLNLL